MRISQQVGRLGRAAVVLGALALGGCASDGYLYDDDPAVRYRGSAGYPPYYFYGYPGSYGYPRHYAPPGYFGHWPYPPRVVHHDHDHRGDDCRHPSHRDGRPDRRPPGEVPETLPPQWRDPPRGANPAGPGAPPQARPSTDDRCAGANCRPSTTPRSEPQPRGSRVERVPEAKEPRKPSEERKELD